MNKGDGNGKEGRAANRVPYNTASVLKEKENTTEEMERRLRQTIASSLKEEGFEYTAKYVEMFGYDNMNPAFVQGANSQTEKFYKRCVEEGHPWDWYFDFPEGVVF